MALQVTVPAQFVLSPPLDLRLRINSENGCFSCARLRRYPFNHDCCSDHFASLHPDGDQGVQRIHEAIDLASTEGACVYAAGSGVATTVQDDSLTITHPGIHEEFATRYVHVTPLVVRNETVVTGQPIATVNASDHGDFQSRNRCLCARTSQKIALQSAREKRQKENGNRPFNW